MRHAVEVVRTRLVPGVCISKRASAAGPAEPRAGRATGSKRTIPRGTRISTTTSTCRSCTGGSTRPTGLELGEPFYRLFWEALRRPRGGRGTIPDARRAASLFAIGKRTGVYTCRCVCWARGSAAGWLAGRQHFLVALCFSGDASFLVESRIPAAQECALFYEDYLQENPNGTLYVSPRFIWRSTSGASMARDEFLVGSAASLLSGLSR